MTEAIFGIPHPWGGLIALALAALFVELVARRVLVRFLNRLVGGVEAPWGQVLHEHRVVPRTSFFLTLGVIHRGIDFVPGIAPDVVDGVQAVTGAVTIVVTALILTSLLDAAHDLWDRRRDDRTKPVKSYVQLAKLVLYGAAGIIAVAALTDRSPWILLSGLGAATAVLLLIFRDTLLSLVAGVKLTSNDSLRVGDWIDMPQFGADGDVEEIALHSVRVRNWDRTVTLIPTHKFLEHSFRNWRAMVEGGGRRIKRSMFVDQDSIRFLTEEETERWASLSLLQDYIRRKREEIREYNARVCADGDLRNGRRLTNIGMFRAYVQAYLRAHPHVHQGMLVLVRQLEPSPEGIPIELYCFTSDTAWAQYEDVQADIFDHLLAMVHEFDLAIYQRPSGRDLRSAFGGVGALQPMSPEASLTRGDGLPAARN